MHLTYEAGVGYIEKCMLSLRVYSFSGYMAPEYAIAGIFSVKSDVFSYGVLLLEIVSGMKNAGSQRRGNSLSLLGYVRKSSNKGIMFSIFCKWSTSNLVAVTELGRHGSYGMRADAMSSLINHYMVDVLRVWRKDAFMSACCVFRSKLRIDPS